MEAHGKILTYDEDPVFEDRVLDSQRLKQHRNILHDVLTTDLTIQRGHKYLGRKRCADLRFVQGIILVRSWDSLVDMRHVGSTI